MKLLLCLTVMLLVSCSHVSTPQEKTIEVIVTQQKNENTIYSSFIWFRSENEFIEYPIMFENQTTHYLTYKVFDSLTLYIHTLYKIDNGKEKYYDTLITEKDTTWIIDIK